MRTECKAAEKEYKTQQTSRRRPARIIFYDSIGKGGGVAAKAFDNVYDTLRKAHEVIISCSCEEGCGNCVQSPACREGNLVCSKIGALLVFQTILGVEIVSTSIPVQGDIAEPTIVEAFPVRAIDRIQVEADIR
jgi:DEAD/DEAH box helicase domain-containing protein